MWKVTTWIQCPEDVAGRFKELLANEMHAAFYCHRGSGDTDSKENSHSEVLIEVEQ